MGSWEKGNNRTVSDSPLPHSQTLIVRCGDKLSVLVHEGNGVDCSQVPVVLLCHLSRLNIPLEEDRDTQSHTSLVQFTYTLQHPLSLSPSIPPFLSPPFLPLPSFLLSSLLLPSLPLPSLPLPSLPLPSVPLPPFLLLTISACISLSKRSRLTSL